MTVKDKERFDEFFYTDKYFRNVTDMDLLRNACECEKLYEYLQNEFSEEEKADVKRYMVFAYALGKYATNNRGRRSR